jgi:hypothetical protein
MMASLGEHVKQLLRHISVRDGMSLETSAGRPWTAVMFGQRELRPSCAVISETWL